MTNQNRDPNAQTSGHYNTVWGEGVDTRPCELCEEPCSAAFEGVVTMHAHRECLLRDVLGGIGHLVAHEYWCPGGLSGLNDPDAGLTYHQSARLVDAWVQIMGVEAAAER